MASTTHEVRQRPAVRALALAAVLMLVGLVLLLMAVVQGPNVLLTAGGLAVIGAGLALFAAALWTARRGRVQVVLDDDGYAIEGRESSLSGGWTDVARVTRGSDRITLYKVDGTRVPLVLARGAGADLDGLGDDIVRRLDASRGYGA